MGNGASVTKDDKRQLELQRQNLMRGVERFVINVYASFPRNESMRIILSSKLASEAFHGFVKAEHAEEYFNLYLDACRIKATPFTTYQLSKEIDMIVSKYIKNESETEMHVMLSPMLQQDCLLALEFDRTDSTYSIRMNELCALLRDESILLMARDQFNRFLLSKFYKSWRTVESSHAIATTAQDASNAVQSKLLSRNNSSQPKIERKGQSVFSMSAMNSTNTGSGRNNKKKPKSSDLSVRAFVNLDVSEIGRVLGAESWLASLLAAVEGLPVSFCMSTARRERRGFPLMYVNNYFEKISGFKRSDVIGKNCRFLQCEESEKSKILILSEALRVGKPATVVMVNRNYENKRLMNLISIKPVFDDKGRYCYVLAIQIDVSREIDDYVSKIKLAEELMDMVPAMLMTDEEEEEPKTGCFPVNKS